MTTAGPKRSARPSSEGVALGFRAKTGWAAVVLLGGPADAPRVLDSRRIELCDPEEPDSRQPYHAGFGTFREDDADIDPAKIANLHMRAHALEGRLYRNLIEEGLAVADLRCEVLVERELWQRASERLGLPEDALKKAVTELGRGVASGWRAESKAAALAAWLARASES